MSNKILTMEQEKRRHTFKRAAKHPITTTVVAASLFYAFAAVSESDFQESQKPDTNIATENQYTSPV